MAPQEKDIQGSAELVRGEVRLASLEVGTAAGAAGRGTGFIAAGAAGLFAIWSLMKIVQRYRYTPFVIYRIALGILILLNLKQI